MVWPTPQDYNEAVQNVQHCFLDEELRSGSVQLNHLGLPKAITGAFASVYRITCGDKSYAVRCFLHDVPDQEVRYERLSKSICSDTLSQTVDFQYQKDGIKIRDRSFPVMKMTWLSGEDLDSYLRGNVEKTDSLSRLQSEFRGMLEDLRKVGFAHGDLQHGNIIITDAGLRLVDYDGMFVPALAGFLSNELGHRNYQHPNRNRSHFGSFLDNFSAWVIDTALTCLIEDNSLYSKLHSDEAALFRQSDFKDPTNSDVFFALEKHDSPKIRHASKVLRKILECEPYNVPPLSDEVSEAADLPRIVEMARVVSRVQEWAVSESIAREEAEAAMLRQAQVAVTGGPPPSWMDEETVKALLAHNPSPPVEENQPAKGKKKQKQVVIPGQGALPSTAQAPPPAAVTFISADDYCNAILQAPQTFGLSLLGLEVIQENGQPCNFGDDNVVVRGCFSNPPTTTVGLPVSLGFANEQQIAVKLFCYLPPDLEKRYELISNAIANLPTSTRKHFIPVTFVPAALEVGAVWRPALLMPWVPNARTLLHVLSTDKPDFDYTLLNRFRRMVTACQSSGIAHGSLEPSNILVVGEDLVLIDYDNLYAKTMAQSGLDGTGMPNRNFAHPREKPTDFGVYIDNFSAWLMDTVLMCWSMDRPLWRTFASNKGALLFHYADLTNPSDSLLFQTLLKSQQWDICQRTGFLLQCLQKNPRDIPPLNTDGIPSGFS